MVNADTTAAGKLLRTERKFVEMKNVIKNDTGRGGALGLALWSNDVIIDIQWGLIEFLAISSCHRILGTLIKNELLIDFVTIDAFGIKI